MSTDEAKQFERTISLIPVAFRSRVRRLVLLTLMSRRGAWASISEIARESRLSPNQVVGALRGSKNQYDPGLSLLRLNIAREEVLEISRKKKQKTYRFQPQNKILQDTIDRVLARYQSSGES